MSTSHSYLDQISFRKLYCKALEKPQMKFYIDGIKCSKCVSKIENLATQVQGLREIEVDLAHQTATVNLLSPRESFGTVAEAIDALGFKAIPLRADEDSSEIWKRESRVDLIRIAVAAFCAGNMMMFAFSIYFGLEGSLKVVFEWIQFLFYLPVVTYVAFPFYKGFWDGLKNKSLSIDGPMAIASFLGFSVSTWNLIRGTGSLYFDSTAGFLFLILASRYFQKRTRFEYLKYLKPQSISETLKARLEQNGKVRWIPSHELQKGQTVQVEKDEWVPADGILLSESIVVDLSVLDGESHPRQIHSGFPVKAGTKLLSEKARVSVIKAGTQTFLGQLLSHLRESSLEQTQSTLLSNKASQWLLSIVLSVGLFTLFIGSFVDFEVYFERAFALIVLACPCAMAFGTPLAISFSMKRAQEKGFILKTPQVFEKLLRVKNVFLDKTGTLTGRQWEISQSSLTSKNLTFQKIILSLEATSQHPVAFGLREIWSDLSAQGLFEVTNRQVLETGVSGCIQGEAWKFASFVDQNQKWFGLFQHEKLVWRFQLQTRLRKGAAELVKALQKRDYSVTLLSGDSDEETRRIASLLKISPDQCQAQMTPQAKAEYIAQYPHSIMIGDGVNDSMALQKADVGIAVHGGVDVALQSAHVLLLHENLESILELFATAKKANSQIKKNLTLALAYNALGGIAALAGAINPFVAALLMPVSSVCILGMTWWGTRP